MMGGIPSDPSESLYWMASELIKKNPSLKILIIHLPFYENYSKIELTDDTAKFNTLNLPFNRESSNANVKVDPKFSHYNQSKIVEKILNNSNIYFEKIGLALAKSERTLFDTSEVREGNFARAAGTVRR